MISLADIFKLQQELHGGFVCLTTQRKTDFCSHALYCVTSVLGDAMGTTLISLLKCSLHLTDTGRRAINVAAHMKEIALLTLQELPSYNQDESEDVAGDAPLNDEGAKRFRESIYNILHDEDLDFKDQVEDRELDISEEKIGSFIDSQDLEDKDDDGMTILHRAVWNNELYSAQTFIQQRCQLTQQSKRRVNSINLRSAKSEHRNDEIFVENRSSRINRYQR